MNLFDRMYKIIKTRVSSNQRYGTINLHKGDAYRMSQSELDILEIISCVGQARSDYIEAIAEAKSGNYEACNVLLKKGNEMYAKGHHLHQQLVQQEAGGERVELTLLLSHAQDQLMSAEAFKILCDEFVDVYRRFDELENRLEMVQG